MSKIRFVGGTRLIRPRIAICDQKVFGKVAKFKPKSKHSEILRVIDGHGFGLKKDVSYPEDNFIKSGMYIVP